MLLFTASDLASITSHIHNWVLFLLWLCLFILSGVISPLISTSIIGIYRPGKFIFHFFIYFNWRLITLQYCSGICHTLTWISHGCTCVHHPEAPLPPKSPSHPSLSSQCTSPEHPVSCIQPGLAICFTYDNVLLSMSYLFAFSYCSWGSPGKNSEVFCHSFLQWTTFCQNFPPWPHLSWVALHSMACSFIELDKAVVHVIGLVSFIW